MLKLSCARNMFTVVMYKKTHACMHKYTHTDRHTHTHTHTSTPAVSINPWLILDLP